MRHIRSVGMLLGLSITAALSLWPPVPAGAQVVITCNGVPATIVGASPGQLNGTAGNDVIVGTTGADQISGLGGDDIICAGDDDDTIIWNPGNGSDMVEGQAGSDTLEFNGSNANENTDLSANGARLRFFRDVANVTMDVNAVEQVNYNALGGADTITVNSLSGTDVTSVTLDLAGTSGGTTGDGQADNVIVNGTATPDIVTIAGDAAGLSVTGLSAAVNIGAAEGARDSLRVNLLDGDDTISTTTPPPSNLKVFLSLITFNGSANLTRIGPAARAVSNRQLDALQGRNMVTAEALPAGVIVLTLSGGPGIDILNGSAGADQVLGGPGNDVANLGAGDDTFVWSPGDGSDVVEGQAGSDTLEFNGSNAMENIGISANGQRLGFSRDVAAVAMDLNATEQVNLHALGGADTISVGDLSSTGVTTVTLDLASLPSAGTGDLQADSVSLSGTAGNDTITISGAAGSLMVNGLSAIVNVSAAEGALDSLRVFALDGADLVIAETLPAGVLSLFLDGGVGDDTLTGSAGNDQFTGGLGADHFSGGPGTDTVTDFNAGQGDTQDTIP